MLLVRDTLGLNYGADVCLITELPCCLLERSEENPENFSHDSPRPIRDLN